MTHELPYRAEKSVGEISASYAGCCINICWRDPSLAEMSHPSLEIRSMASIAETLDDLIYALKAIRRRTQ